MKVLVINKHGRPLMPTTQRKARILLKVGKAKIAGRDPFTIQLIYGASGYTQPVALGIDSGYQHIGFSAITEKEELIGGELEMLDGMTERITERAMYRRQRRNRLRHRTQGFDNRRRYKGWLPPSIQHKLDTHALLIERIKSRLPVMKVIVETAKFDIQKINNPDVLSKQYQQGEQLGYANITAYIRHRDGYKCQNPNCILILQQIRRNKRSLEQFYDAKYIDIRTGEKTTGSKLFSGRRTRNKNLNGENLRIYRGHKISKGQRRIKRQRYPYNPNDYVEVEGKVYFFVGMQNLGTGVKIANYPGVANKVVNVCKVRPIKRRSGICE